jgi:hypothetical protein
VRCSPTELGAKETEVKIIGCDLHARQQTLAMLETNTGEVVKRTLKHEGNSNGRSSDEQLIVRRLD